MPTYRVYCAQWDASELLARDIGAEKGFVRVEFDSASFEGTWADEVEARNPAGALKVFFRERGIPRNEIVWFDEHGRGHEVRKGEGFDTEKHYTWVEDGKLMRFVTVLEAAPGMTVCPLCSGSGEVPTELAELIWEEEARSGPDEAGGFDP